jgi:mono/diheme cytochrome c family protein
MMERNAPLFVLLCAGLSLAACGRPDELPRAETAAAPATALRAAAMPDFKLRPDQIERGRRVYERHCQTCHGPEGRGQPGDWRQRKPNGLYPPPPLNDDAHAWHHPTAVLKKAILQGSPPDVGDMPAWQGKLSDAEIDDVIVYVKSLWSPEIYRHWMEIETRALAN